MITKIKTLGFAFFSRFKTHDIRQDSFMMRSFYFMAVLLIVQFALMGAYYFSFPEVVVMHSNIYFGIDLIGARIYSLLIPLAALIVAMVHGMVIIRLYRSEREVARLFMAGTLVVIALLFTNVFFIINLNL